MPARSKLDYPFCMNDKSSKVAILMGTCNGAAYLEEQLQSLLHQGHPDIDILISDDGSTDTTLDIVQRWAENWPKGTVKYERGPNEGFAENFRTLIAKSPADADYFAFCDQDDIWEPEKLERAVNWLESRPPAVPRLFCSRTQLVSETGEAIGLSPLFRRPPSFRNALVQSIAGANTMVFNRAARDLLVKASSRSSFVSQDWWSYLIVSGAGGEVCYCSEPLVRYRQHSANQVGANVSLASRLFRIRRLLEGQLYRWTNENMEGLGKNLDLLAPEAQETCRLFQKIREGHLLQRLRSLRACRVYRQTRLGNLALAVAVVLKQI